MKKCPKCGFKTLRNGKCSYCGYDGRDEYEKEHDKLFLPFTIESILECE